MVCDVLLCCALLSCGVMQILGPNTSEAVRDAVNLVDQDDLVSICDIDFCLYSPWLGYCAWL